MLTWIIFGFLLGLQHALEADHIAAVASIAADKKGIRPIIRHGAMWGLGHAVTLGVFRCCSSGCRCGRPLVDGW